MSHELRTPLNAIIGFSDILRNERFGPLGAPRYLEYARDINQSGVHLLSLIDDILDISKAEAGKLELLESDIAVADLVDKPLRLMQPKAAENGLTLDAVLATPNAWLRGDERKLLQILLNLLSNAVKFTPPGGRVLLRQRLAEDGAVVFAIEDTGIGIAQEDIATVFSEFGQIADPHTRGQRGSGLGIPLAVTLVELHGGKLHLESEIGVGTTVTSGFNCSFNGSSTD